MSNTNLSKYKGSGKYWRRHLKKHGNDVSTKVVAEFDDPAACREFATKFSIDNNIVESHSWANLQIENGQDGAPLGHVGSRPNKKSKTTISKKCKEVWKNYREKIIDAQKKSWTIDRRKKQSTRLSSVFWTEERRKSHSKKLSGRVGHKKCKGVPKHKDFGNLISRALSGKPKSQEHLKNLAMSRQKDKRVFIDHLGNRYDLHSDFSNKYGVAMNTFRDLDAKITRHTPVYEKLGIDFNYAKNKTKRELGFRFE